MGRRRKVILTAIFLLISAVAVSAGVQYELNNNIEKNAYAGEPLLSVEPKNTELELPFGGRTLLPGHRYVGLYGTPSMPALGALGHQDISNTIARAKAIAAEYQPYSSEKIVPIFEIIVTVASSDPTSNGDYSQEIDIEKIRPLVDAAKEAGVYVVLDLQPGRVSFLEQARLYEPLLLEPHVGLALDPEWRIGPTQVHLKQIGSVSAAEVNQLSAWLADLTKTHGLPQKMLVLHQFKLAMLPDRQNIDTSRAELAYVIQMDGQGTQAAKLDTWRTLIANPPANTYFGWKNFYAKDLPVRTPADTMAIEPKPWFVSYQ